MAIAELPSWLAAEERYEPVGARHRVMQKNVLHLASLLERVRLGGGAHEGGSMVDRALSCVSAPVRLVGMFVCVLCVCLTQSPLYLMLMAAIALVLVAVRPVRGLRATFVPALGAAGLAVVLVLLALLLDTSAAGAMLKIKPIITFSQDGQLQSIAKVRGRRQVQDKIIELMHKHLNGRKRRYNLGVANGGAPEEMAEFSARLRAEFPDYEHCWEGALDATLSVYIGDGVLGGGIQFLD